VDKKAKSEIDKIEETQDALRESIEESKRLTEKAQNLLEAHKKNLEKSKT
jgi:DNA gyrase/topoisomerase IV subunit A